MACPESIEILLIPLITQKGPQVTILAAPTWQEHHVFGFLILVILRCKQRKTKRSSRGFLLLEIKKRPKNTEQKK
jgi:hypothetical protein